MSIYQELQRDHDDLRDMIAAINKLPGSAKGSKQRLFEKLKVALTDHARAEEAVFYEAIMGDEKARHMALEGHEEHHVIDLLLAEIVALSPDEEAWDAKFEVLRENVEHHLEEEEDDLFKKARQILSSVEADRLGARFKMEKDKIAVSLML